MQSLAHEVEAVKSAHDEVNLTLTNQISGDWHAYKNSIDNSAAIDDAASRLTQRRQAALAYLGSRAQLVGGVYNSASPTVFTAQAIQELSAKNRERRDATYPWLAELLAIMDALQNDQNAKGLASASIISFRKSRLA